MDEIGQLGDRLVGFCGRFRSYLQTKTRDTSEYGFRYLSGILRMETKRNFANIGRKTGVSGQNLQHFISNSPWSASGLIEAVQREIQTHPAFRGASWSWMKVQKRRLALKAQELDASITVVWGRSR